MRDRLAVPIEQIGLGKTSMKLLQALERDCRNDVMFEVVFHPGADEVVLEPTSDTGSCNPVHGVCISPAPVEMFRCNCLQSKDHGIHADDRDEPENDVEHRSTKQPLKEQELAEDDQLSNGLPDKQPRAGEEARRCTGGL